MIFPQWVELKHISMDFKFCLLAGGRPPHVHLSESHNFQANTSDDGGDRKRRENASNSV